MSFSSRLKERRENLKLSRADLAALIGVTASAISNYENEVSSPKADLLYGIFEALKCDANYLYQDDISISYEFKANLKEQEHIKKYRQLDDYGKKQVDTTLDNEYERCNQDMHFITIEDARDFMKSRPMYGMGGIDVEKMDEDKLLKWANDFWTLEQKAKDYLD